MKKEITKITIVTFVVAGLLGFYGGRYYEQGRMTKMMEERRASMSNDSESGEMKRPAGMMPGMGVGGMRAH